MAWARGSTNPTPPPILRKKYAARLPPELMLQILAHYVGFPFTYDIPWSFQHRLESTDRLLGLVLHTLSRSLIQYFKTRVARATKRTFDERDVRRTMLADDVLGNGSRLDIGLSHLNAVISDLDRLTLQLRSIDRLVASRAYLVDFELLNTTVGKVPAVRQKVIGLGSKPFNLIWKVIEILIHAWTVIISRRSE